MSHFPQRICPRVYLAACVLGILLLPLTQSVGQNRTVDSLKILLEDAVRDSARIELLLQLCREYGHENPGEASRYCNEALDIARNAPVQAWLSHCLMQTGLLHEQGNRYEAAMRDYREALSVSRELSDSSQIATAMTNIGILFWSRDNYQMALEFFLSALRIREELDEKHELAKALNNVGVVYERQGNLEKALEFHTRSLEVKMVLGNRRSIANSLMNQGNIHKSMGNHAQALENYHRGMDVYAELGDRRGVAMMMTNIGITYAEQQEYDSSMVYLERSLRMKRELGNRQLLSTTLINLGELHLALGWPDSARAVFREALAIGREFRSKRTIADSYLNLSKADLMQDDHVSALNNYMAYAEVKDSLLNEESLHQINELTARYEADNREKRIELLEKDKRLNDLELKRQRLQGVEQQHAFQLLQRAKEIQNLEMKQTATELDRQRVANERKDREVVLLVKERELQESRIARETLIRNVIIAGFAVAIILALLIYHGYRLKKRSTEQLGDALSTLKRTQAQLIHSEKMATLGELTAGIAHEIRNPLNFIDNFAVLSKELATELAERLRNAEDEPAEASLQETTVLLEDLEQSTTKIHEHAGRVNSIVSNMLMHLHLHSGETETIDINSFLNRYIDLASQGARAQTQDFNIRILRNFDPDAGLVPLNRQQIGRVFLNLLSNAFHAVRTREEHEISAYKPTVAVRTLRRNDVIEIIVEDNGDGIAEEHRDKVFEPFFTTKPSGSGTGLGLSLSYDIVVNGHGGNLHFRNLSDGGAAFSMELPATAQP